jgi:hypothetical protein
MRMNKLTRDKRIQIINLAMMHFTDPDCDLGV